MKRSLFVKLKELFSSKSTSPWACAEFNGVEADGRVGFAISWNKAFIQNIERAGFQGINEEETVQNFLMFIAAGQVTDDVNPEEMPTLTSDSNILLR